MTGLGIASMYPFTSVEAIAAVPDATNLASARLTLGAGLAIFTAPLFMGWVADQIGIRSAYPIALVLVAARFRHGAPRAPDARSTSGQAFQGRFARLILFTLDNS